MSSEKNILEQSREALYHNLHDIKPKIEPEAHWLPPNMQCYSSHHNDNPAPKRGLVMAGASARKCALSLMLMM